MYDYIIVGSGIAGLYTALLAQQEGQVLILTKAGLSDTNTNHAQGGIAAAVGADDAPRLHWQDTIAAGTGLADPTAAWILAREGPECIQGLLQLGVPFDLEGGGIALAQEGAHCRRRVLHAGGDATGARIQDTLCRLVRQAPNITVREDHLATEVIVDGGIARGFMAMDRQTGRQVRYGGRINVLATGGAGQLYQHTTNPPVATGSGIALAYRAGASVADLEFCQFHPTALQIPEAPRFLISEAARGEGGMLRLADGRRFMFDYDPRGELAPRHVVANAILAEMARADASCVYLDLSHLPVEQVAGRFPVIAAFCRQYGIDITKEPIPVAPAAHYMMGGVRTDLWGETDLRGLFACGEVACTGVHGGNRLASNSLLEALVFGSRIVRRSAAHPAAEDSDCQPCSARESSRMACPPSEDMPLPSGVLEDQRFGPDPTPTLRDLSLTAMGTQGVPAKPFSIADVQALMWAHAGVARSRQSLREAQRALDKWSAALSKPRVAASYELQDLLLVARLVVTAATTREESRGAHRRVDFPTEDEAWRRRLVYKARRAAAEVAARASDGTLRVAHLA